MTRHAASVHSPRFHKLSYHGHLQLCISSLVGNITPTVDELMGFIGKFRPRDGSELNVEIALREALANAIIHGNKLNANKHVYVACRCSADGGIRIRVQDEGDGFSAADISDPTIQENLLCTSGRGIHLMDSLIDEVKFLACGSIVQLRMASNILKPASRPGATRRRSGHDRA